MTLVVCGIKTGDTAAEAIDAAGQMTLKVPGWSSGLILIIVGYFIYRAKYKIDEKMARRARVGPESPRGYKAKLNIIRLTPGTTGGI